MVLEFGVALVSGQTEIVAEGGKQCEPPSHGLLTYYSQNKNPDAFFSKANPHSVLLISFNDVIIHQII